MLQYFLANYPICGQINLLVTRDSLIEQKKNSHTNINEIFKSLFINIDTTEILDFNDSHIMTFLAHKTSLSY
jgi:hypothetical protein